MSERKNERKPAQDSRDGERAQQHLVRLFRREKPDGSDQAIGNFVDRHHLDRLLADAAHPLMVDDLVARHDALDDMWGPAGTPPEIVNRVNTELVRGLTEE